MATIRASCSACGDVELTTRQVRVVVCSTTNAGAYTFQCPMCLISVSKPAESRVIDILVASGVAVSTWEMPAELDEVHYGPAISHDDLLEFHFHLQRRNCLNELAEGNRQLQRTAAPDREG